MNTQSSMQNIPVLTEIISPPPSAEAPAETHSPARQKTISASSQPPLSDFLENKREWDDLERRLTQRILQLVHERIDFILAHAIKDSLATVLNKATEELAAEIRSDLHNTLEVVVAHAVTQEIAHLQQEVGNMSDNESESL